jgi:hypothetical protein
MTCEAKFLTDGSSLDQRPEPNKWLMVFSELFRDTDGSIYLVPRNYITDNYSIPDWISWLAGGKSKYNAMPAHLHDFGCQYHQLIKVNLTEDELYKKKFLEISKRSGKVICKDIPLEYLSLVPIKKWDMDCMFKRCMKATNLIPARVYNTYRCGVFFNFGWLGNHPPFDLSKIYTIKQNDKAYWNGD